MRRPLTYLPLFLAFCGLLFAGCQKEKGIDTTLEVTTLYQIVNRGPEALYPFVEGYIFPGDTTLYSLESYEQAASGELTLRGEGGAVVAEAEGIQSTTGLLSFPGITRAASVIVIYDTQEEAYAWRNLKLEEGIPRITSRLRFRRWRAGETYKEAGWLVRMPAAEELPPEP